MATEKTSFNLPYNQSAYYWLAIYTPAGNEALRGALAEKGLKPFALRDSVYMIRLSHPWDKSWNELSSLIDIHDPEALTEVALVTGEQEPGMEEIDFARKSVAMIDGLASSLWLGEAMIEDRIVCYMQPVIDKRNKVFGYEAFARVETDGQGVIGGGQILEASKWLNVEYILDRHLHVKAITSFITSDLEGFLFINFIPGFIHRPEKYLEGLSEAAKFHGMPAKQLVLDLTHSEVQRDPQHMKSIFEYCRSKGYSLALDDISSVAMAKKIFDTIRPDFIKLDVHLVRDAQGMPQQATIAELVALARASGATVLAEGVESAAVQQELSKAGVELFQGYLFSPPVAVAKLTKKVAG